VIIGAGINVSMREPVEPMIDQGWINLQEAGIEIDRNALAAAIINELRQALPLFEREGFAAFHQRWQVLDNYYNRPVKLLIGEREITGIARGINNQGALLLEQGDEIKPYLGGEISLRGM